MDKHEIIEALARHNTEHFILRSWAGEECTKFLSSETWYDERGVHHYREVEHELPHRW